MARTRGAAGVVIDPAAQPGLVDPNDDFDDADDEDPIADKFGDLALLTQADDDVEWGVMRYKTTEEMKLNPRGKPLVFVTKLAGKVDLPSFQAEHGGGTFRFYGRRGQVFYGSKVVELAGARKNYDAIAVTTALPARIAAPLEDDPGRRERRMIRKLYRELLDLRREVQQQQQRPPASPQPLVQGLGIEQAFALADRIAQRTQAPESPVDKIADALMRGIDIGTGREAAPAPAGNEWVAVAKEIVPAIRELLGFAAANARAKAAAAQRANPAAKPARPVEHEVVGDTPPTSAAPAAPAVKTEGQSVALGEHRWLTAIEKLAEAVATEMDPLDFAADLEAILSPQEIALFKGASYDELVAKAGIFIDSFPILKTDAARAFTDRLIEVLNHPPDEA